MRTSDLRMREVVNTTDGRRLGFISDLDLDLDSGRIRAFIIPGPRKLLSLFGKSEDVAIPFGRVMKIGVDFILVDADAIADSFPLDRA